MSQNGIKKGIAYYHCSNKTGCGKYSEQTELENKVAEKFKDLQFSPDFIELVIEKAKRQYLEKRKTYDGRRQAFVNKKTALENKRRVAEDKLLEKAITNEDFARIRADISADLKRIDEELLTIQDEQEIDIDIVQEILLLTQDIHQAYTQASFKLKRQYLAFFWERFEVADGVILNSVPTPLFQQLLDAEHVFRNKPKTKKTASTAASSGGILTTVRLRGQDSNLRPSD